MHDEVRLSVGEDRLAVCVLWEAWQVAVFVGVGRGIP